MEREKSILKKGYRALDGRGTRALALIDQLRREELVELLCSVFEVTRSCYYAHCQKRRSPDVARLALRVRVKELFTQSRSAAGSRTIMCMMLEEGIQIGRFKVRKLMREMKLISKQAGSHATRRPQWSALTSRMCWSAHSMSRHRIKYGAATSRTCGLKVSGTMWRQLSTCLYGAWWDRRFQLNRTVSWPSKRWTWRTSTVGGRRMCCFVGTRVASMAAKFFDSGCGVTVSGRA